MQKEGKQFQTQIGDHVLTFETGKLAGLAGGALTLRVGDTMVFSTASMSSNIRQGIDFLPCLLYTSPSPRDRTRSRMPSSA